MDTISLQDRIEELAQQAMDDGGYITVKAASKKLNVKQTDIKDNLPAGATLIPSTNGTLAESKITLGAVPAEEEYLEDQLEDDMDEERVPTPEELMDGEDDGYAEIADASGGDGALPAAPVRPKREKKAKVEKELDPNTTICVICGNPIRTTTMPRRGICPRCFQELARTSKNSAKQLMDMAEDDFNVIVGNEVSRRGDLIAYKQSRFLTPEEFNERRANLIPVKELFAVAKEAGFGPGRVATAVGGDRFRHAPLGGFGSIWTPYFYGPRNGWYFDRDILNHLSELVKPPSVKKAKKEKQAADGNSPGNGRKGGKRMKPVVAAGAAPMQSIPSAEGTTPQEEDAVPF